MRWKNTRKPPEQNDQEDEAERKGKDDDKADERMAQPRRKNEDSVSICLCSFVTF
jgi:hypothetical protein